MMYFLSVSANDELLRERVRFADYAEAVAACGEYYEPRVAGATLNFTTVVTGKKFMRSHAQLVRMADLGSDVPRDSPRAVTAAKQSNAFTFARSYTFLIESEEGVREADRMAQEEDDE